MDSSRRAARLGLAAAILLLLGCVTLLIGASLQQGSTSLPTQESSQHSVTR